MKLTKGNPYIYRDEIYPLDLNLEIWNDLTSFITYSALSLIKFELHVFRMARAFELLALIILLFESQNREVGEVVLRWKRNRMGRLLSPPQIHQKNI